MTAARTYRHFDSDGKLADPQVNLCPQTTEVVRAPIDSGSAMRTALTVSQPADADRRRGGANADRWVAGTAYRRYGIVYLWHSM